MPKNSKALYKSQITMKVFTPFLLILIFISCASENEQKALNKVADIYSAKTTYSKNFNSKAGQGTIYEFNIIVSNSKLIDTLPKAPLTSNIAYLVYDNFNEKEKDKYHKINVKIVTSSKDTIKNSYDTPVLKEIVSKANTFNLFSKNTIEKNYNALNALKDDEAIPQSITAFMKDYINKAEEKLGKLTGYKPLLISKNKTKYGPLLQFVGLFTFENGQFVKYSMQFNEANKNDKIIGFDFL